MIVNEHFKIGEVDFTKTYSNLSVLISCLNENDQMELYQEASYPSSLSSSYSFEETDIPINPPEDEEEPVNQ